MSDKKIWYFGEEEPVDSLEQERGVITSAKIAFTGYQSHFLGLEFDMEYGPRPDHRSYWFHDKNDIIDFMNALGISSENSQGYLDAIPLLQGKELTIYRISSFREAGFSAGCELELAVRSAS